MIIPQLPSYLTSLGGGEYKGLIIGLFTLTAMASRPLSGKLADKLGRIPVMIIGAVVCFICGLLYPVLSTVAGFLLLRLVHGFSTGFSPTGATALVADIIPAHKRGEAMGIVGTAGSLGSAAGPSISDTLVNNFSMNVMFYCSSFLAILSIIVIIGMKETLVHRNRFDPSMFKIGKHEIFELRVWVPCVIMFLGVYAYGTVYTLIADFAQHVGIKDKGLLFGFLTIASLTVRLIAGKTSDRYGRRVVLRVSTVLITVSMIVIGLATRPGGLMLGVTLYGLAQGITSPALLAWATDLSEINKKGKGISSLYMSMEFGIFCGSISSGFIYGNNPANFGITFFISAVLSLTAFILLFFLKTPAHAR